MLTIYFSTVCTRNDYVLLQQDVDVLGVWSLLNHLSFNTTKCKTMVLSRKKLKTTPSQVFLLGSQLESVDSFKYLGLLIKCDLTWTDHIKQICSKARKLVGLLFQQFYNYADPSNPTLGNKTESTDIVSVIQTNLKQFKSSFNSLQPKNSYICNKAHSSKADLEYTWPLLTILKFIFPMYYQ